jgi:hypothetical protein
MPVTPLMNEVLPDPVTPMTATTTSQGSRVMSKSMAETFNEENANGTYGPGLRRLPQWDWGLSARPLGNRSRTHIARPVIASFMCMNETIQNKARLRPAWGEASPTMFCEPWKTRQTRLCFTKRRAPGGKWPQVFRGTSNLPSPIISKSNKSSSYSASCCFKLP